MPVLKEGYLVKAPMSIGSKHSSSIFSMSKKNQTRFFVLDGATLKYYVKQGEAKPLKTLDLTKQSIVKRINGTDLVVIPFPGSKKELFVSATNEKESQEWSDALNKACNADTTQDHVDEEEHKDGNDTESSGSEAEDNVELAETGEQQQQQKHAEAGEDQIPAWKKEWLHRLYGNTKLRLRKVQFQTIKEGQLGKFNKSLLEGRWNPTYFVLDSELKAYPNKEAFAANEGCTIYRLDSVITRNISDGTHFQFEVLTLGETVMLRCQTEQEMEEWMEAIDNCHYNLQPVETVAQYKGVDSSKKCEPEFLRIVREKKLEEEKARRTSSFDESQIPPPSMDVDDDVEDQADKNDDANDMTDDDSGSMSTSPPPAPTPNDDQADAKEDRFAKLRALKAKKQFQ